MKIKRIIILLSIWFVCPLSAYAQALASGCESAIETITLGGDHHYPPFHYTGPEGTAQGFDVDIARAVARTVCLELETSLGGWTATLAALEAGDIDIVPMFITTPRRERYLFSDPVLHRYHVVFGRTDADNIDSIGDLADYRVIVQRDGAAHERLSALGFDEDLVLTNSEPAALRLLASGRYDYALVPELTGRYVIRMDALHNVNIFSPPMLDLPYAFGMTRGNDTLVNLFNNGLRDIKQSGLYDEIHQRWFTDIHAAETRRYFILNLTMVILAALLLAGAIVLYRSARFRAAIRKQARRIVNETRLRKISEDKAHFLAYHDTITRLPNLNLITENLNERLETIERNGKYVGVIYFNLVEYPLLVQTFGLSVGYKLLQRVSTTLKDDRSCLAGMLSPGIFIAITEPVTDAKEIYTITRGLISPLEDVHLLGETSLDVSCRVGLSIYPQDGTNSETLIRHAELAHSNAIIAGKPLIRYTHVLEPDQRNLKLIADLREALRRDNQLFLLYQPQYNPATGEIEGCECLIRWNHPEYGMLAPNIFIPLAEKTGLIREITHYVVAAALKKQQELRTAGSGITLSVNISARDICDEDFSANLLELVGNTDTGLTIEITETAATSDLAQVRRNTDQLADAGIRLSIDDYGTGFSSLSYLKYLTPAELKIDIMFIRDLLHSRYDQTLVKATIDMARTLGIRVVSEGVENAGTLDYLKTLDCDLIQGYYVSKPLTDMEFEAFRKRGFLYH